MQHLETESALLPAIRFDCFSLLVLIIYLLRLLFFLFFSVFFLFFVFVLSQILSYLWPNSNTTSPVTQGEESHFANVLQMSSRLLSFVFLCCFSSDLNFGRFHLFHSAWLPKRSTTLFDLSILSMTLFDFLIPLRPYLTLWLCYTTTPFDPARPLLLWSERSPTSVPSVHINRNYEKNEDWTDEKNKKKTLKEIGRVGDVMYYTYQEPSIIFFYMTFLYFQATQTLVSINPFMFLDLLTSLRPCLTFQLLKDPVWLSRLPRLTFKLPYDPA